MSITNTRFRTLLLFLSLILIVAGFLLLPEKAMAAEGDIGTQTVNGIVWTYKELADGTVGVGGKTTSVSSTPAVPTATSGSITIPNTLGGKTVTQISDRAFYYCSNLTSITIPNSVTLIENKAFSDCEKLASIIIPNGVTSIGEMAFYNCTALTSITIPNSLISIGTQAFFGCSELTSITIPDSVTSIGSSIVRKCTKLTSINVEENNQHYKSDDGVLLSKDGTILMAYPAGKTETSYTIPDGVISINHNAFSYCASIKSVTMSNSVISTGNNIFYSCNALTSVTISNKLESIGANTFYNCAALTSITIPNSVTSIGSYAFYGCSNITLTTIENSTAHTYALANPTIFTTINVISAPTITITPSGNVSLSIGNSLTLEATVSEGAAPYTYQWQFNNTPIPNADTTTLSIPSVTTADAGAYTLIVSGAMDTIVTSAPVSVTVTTETPFALAPTANRNLTLASIMEGAPSEPITLSSEITGGVAPYTYAWEKDGTPLANTAPTLTLSNPTVNDLGTYTVTITDANGTVITNEIVLRNAAAGITGDNNGTSDGTIMIGVIQPLQIKAVVPTVITFHVDPNGPTNYTSVPGGALTAPSFSFQNACNAPLSFAVNEITAQAGNPAVVMDNTFSDAEWAALTKTQTLANIAFGFVADTPEQWAVQSGMDNWYELTKLTIGTLNGKTSADLHLKSKYGLAWGNATEQTITYDVVYLVELAQ